MDLSLWPVRNNTAGHISSPLRMLPALVPSPLALHLEHGSHHLSLQDRLPSLPLVVCSWPILGNTATVRTTHRRSICLGFVMRNRPALQASSLPFDLKDLPFHSNVGWKSPLLPGTWGPGVKDRDARPGNKGTGALALAQPDPILRSKLSLPSSGGTSLSKVALNPGCSLGSSRVCV